MSRLPAFIVVVAGAVGAACSGDDDATPPRVRLTVRVVEEPLLAGDANDRPVAGAEVAFDPPSGSVERVTATAGDDGRATFDVDEGALRGGAAVTVYSAEHLSYSRLDVTEREITLVIPRLDNATSERTVQLSGAITGKTPVGSTVDLSASKLDRLGRTTTPTETYALRVPRSQPFFLIGHEQLTQGALVRSFRIDVSAKDADARLDIDLPSVPALTARSVHVKVTPPASMTSGATITANVVSAESSLFVGTPGKVEGNDVELSVVDTDLGGEHVVTRGVVIGADGARSVRTEVGVAQDGTSWSDLAECPKIPEASRLKTDPIPLSDFPDGAELRVEMIAGGKLGWVLLGPPGGLRDKTIRLPPSFRVEFPSLVAVTIAAQIDPVDVAPGRRVYRRVGVSRDVLLHR